MCEREPPPYWQDERPLDRIYFAHHHWLVHARSHIAGERYSRATTSEVDLFQLPPRGQRTWVQSRLFIHAPEDSRHEVAIGAGQAHYYPAGRLLTIWELFTEERFRTHTDPREDLLLRGLWRSFERLLVARFPTATGIGALWETDYAIDAWAGFLTTLGYHQRAAAVFFKPVSAMLA